MKGSRLVQNLILVFSTRSCHATAGSSRTVAATLFDVRSRRAPHVERYQSGKQSPKVRLFSRQPTSTAPANRNPYRPVATAVASSGSHLETGRSVSGVLENCIEAGLNTFGAFVSGTITGCVIGGFMGGTFRRVPDVGWLKSVQTKAGQMGGDWGKLTAAFTGFTSASTVIRGRNDKWDQVVGACGAGAFLNRAKGPSAMAQGAATYGLFSLIFAVQSKPDELDVVDVPVDAMPKK